MWGQIAKVALAKKGDAHMAARLIAGRFFMERIMPETAAHLARISAGAATIPEMRKQGAQGELLKARLAYAAERGIELAMIVTQPGSGSQRNAERRGFRPVYTRMKWRR